MDKGIQPVASVEKPIQWPDNADPKFILTDLPLRTRETEDQAWRGDTRWQKYLPAFLSEPMWPAHRTDQMNSWNGCFHIHFNNHKHFQGTQGPSWGPQANRRELSALLIGRSSATLQGGFVHPGSIGTFHWADTRFGLNPYLTHDNPPKNTNCPTHPF